MKPDSQAGYEGRGIVRHLIGENTIYWQVGQKLANKTCLWELIYLSVDGKGPDNTHRDRYVADDDLAISSKNLYQMSNKQEMVTKMILILLLVI